MWMRASPSQCTPFPFFHYFPSPTSFHLPPFLISHHLPSNAIVSHQFPPHSVLCILQNLWFANPGGSNSMPSRSHSSVQRTRSLPVHTSPQTMLMFQQPGRKQAFPFCFSSSHGVEVALPAMPCSYLGHHATRMPLGWVEAEILLGPTNDTAAVPVPCITSLWGSSLHAVALWSLCHLHVALVWKK